jgi:hypothetical protein
MKHIQRYLITHRASGARVHIEPFSTGDNNWWAHILHRPGSKPEGIAAAGESMQAALERLEARIKDEHPNLFSDAEKRVVQIVDGGWFYLRSKDHRSIDTTRQFATAEEAVKAAEASAALTSLVAP